LLGYKVSVDYSTNVYLPGGWWTWRPLWHWVRWVAQDSPSGKRL